MKRSPALLPRSIRADDLRIPDRDILNYDYSYIHDSLCCLHPQYRCCGSSTSLCRISDAVFSRDHSLGFSWIHPLAAKRHAPMHKHPPTNIPARTHDPEACFPPTLCCLSLPAAYDASTRSLTFFTTNAFRLAPLIGGQRSANRAWRSEWLRARQERFEFSPRSTAALWPSLVQIKNGATTWGLHHRHHGAVLCWRE